MEKIIRAFSDHQSAEAAARADDDQMTLQQRFDAFMKLMEPYYAVAGGFQRIYRVDDLRQRTVRDEWRICVQPVSKPESDG